MSSNIQITPAQLSRLVGLPDAPVLLDVRIDEDVAADPRLLPASEHRSHRDVADWAGVYAGRKVVVICQRGQKLSEGVAAWLRHEGVEAETLAGGFEAWREAGGLLVETGKLPAERVFIVAPKMNAEGIKDKGRQTRVDFALK